MKKEFKIIIGGLCVILLFAGAVFFGLYYFLGRQTEKDVRNIAQVFLEETAEQKENRFETIKEMRFARMDSMKSVLQAHQEEYDASMTQSALVRAAAFQELANCTLISESGAMETVYGDEIVRLEEEAYLMDSLRAGQERIVTDGQTTKEAVIIFAAPLSAPMTNGGTSAGMLWCEPALLFADIMDLNNPDLLEHFHLIRQDTSYVIEADESCGTSFADNALNHAVPEGMTAEEHVNELYEAMATDGVFVAHTRYVDQSQDMDILRSVHAMPLADTDWYLLTVMPYGVLDETIADMGQARSRALFTAIGILFLVLLTVFGIYLRITHRQIVSLEEAKEAAEHATEEAIAANKAKSEFLSNMSHDIRTPMNAIVGMTAIANEHIDDKERVRDCLKKITLSGKQLLGLINDVLDMSKIESGKMTLNQEPLSLKETMETMRDIIRPQIKENGQHFDIVISNILSDEVYCDSVRLNQVLLNFLSNAMKFTPKDGHIFIDLRQEESPKGEKYVRTHFSVRDTGIGMSEKFRQKMFTAFEREDSSRVQKIQGTGLGLTITKHIVDAMDGTIQVQSELGVGSTFQVTVDFERAPDSTGEMHLPNWRILVVDDNEDLCQTTAMSLSELGTRPDICLSGEEAIGHVVEAQQSGDRYFAILLDYKLNGISGVETARQIREKIGNDVPISLISAYDWSDIEEEARKAGITDYIAKPLFKSTLYYELRKYASAEDGIDNSPVVKKEADLAGLRILLAEDIEINAEIATMILEEFGCTVEWAEDGKIAAEKFSASEEGYYDAVLMDLRMPNMNGFGAAQTIRSADRSDAATIPIIAMTADAFAEDAQKCLAAGMNAHITKPIDVDELKRNLAKFTGRG